MRLSQKIGISSLLFFLLVYLTAGIGIIENNKKTAMNRILQLSADEQNSISSGIIKYVLVNRAKNNTGMNIDDSVYITEYLDSEEGKGTLVQIIFPGYKQDTKQLYDDNCIQ